MRAFSSGSGLGGQRLQCLHVFGIEFAGALVERLGHADDFTAIVADRHTKQVARTVTGFGIYPAVETRIGIGVGNDFARAAGEHGSRNALTGGETHFAHGITLHHAGKQFTGFGIVQEQRAALGVQRFGHDLQQPCKQHVQGQRIGNAVGDIDQCGIASGHGSDTQQQLGLAGIRQLGKQLLHGCGRQPPLENAADDLGTDLRFGAPGCWLAHRSESRSLARPEPLCSKIRMSLAVSGSLTCLPCTRSQPRPISATTVWPSLTPSAVSRSPDRAPAGPGRAPAAMDG
jgi:hypothetical protein